MTTEPSAIFAHDAAIVPAEYSAPTLPSLTPVAHSAREPETASSAAFDLSGFYGATETTRKGPTKHRGRTLFNLVLMLGLLGGGAWLATNHGPEWYDQYVRGDDAAEATEVDAPLAFPTIASPPEPIRTAEFILTGLPETPGATYRVTTDFETNVSQVDITRDTGPDLQVLTYGNDAMIRQTDGQHWYLLERGQFPLDDRLQRSDWVRWIHELVPTDIRHLASIDSSTESVVSGVATRHLTISLDPALLKALPTVGLAGGPLQLGEAAESAGVVEPTAEVVAVEVWVDGNGLVRQVRGAPHLGAEMITIVTTSADSWVPTYPTPAEIVPLTASALLELGI